MNRRAGQDELDAREFVARQFALEFQAGAKVGAAASRLRAALPPYLAGAIDGIEGAFAGRVSPHAPPLLARTLQVARDRKALPERAFVAYEEAMRRFAPEVSAVFAGARTIGTYLASMLLLLTIVVGTYSFFALPQFAALFEDFNARLPFFTTALLANRWLPLLLLLLIAGCCAGFLVVLSRLKQRLLGLEPVGSLLGRVPGFRDWSRQHDYSLWALYQSMLLDAGASPEGARAGANELAGEPPDSRRRQLLEVAASLGRLREELARQSELLRSEALAGLEGPRNAFILILRLVIYLLVGSYVLAMYLPIFKLGAII